MRILYLLAGFIFLLGTAMPASAARFSGSYLLQMCEMSADGRETVPGGHTTCQAYIAGVIDYHNVLQSLNIAPNVNICISEKVTMNDVHAVVLDYLRKHGEHDDFVAAPAVTMALYEVFPCKSKNRKK